MPRCPDARTWLALALLCGSSGPLRAESPAAPAAEFFEKEVRPLLADRCLECHGDVDRPKGGLRLTSREAVLKGGDSGPAAVPGEPEQSLLIEAVRYNDEPRMPPKARLSDRQIDSLTRWVASGLPWPSPAASGGPEVKDASRPADDDPRRFWSFRPVRDVVPPAVRDTSWPRSGIDRFILSALESRGLKPAVAADKRTLIRRATFDLTGLPPTPDQVDAFLADDSPMAFARVVDRLLASPQYGERWGRHWLDVVRYTDSFDARGEGGAGDIADAWRYRDWVVAAFNRDMPYDEFVMNQVAGDLLPASDPGGVNADGIVATGLLAIGNWGGGDADKEKLLTDIADDQVDVVSRAFLGLTIACARCHDHKFDPIPTVDYYGLAGIFFSTHILPSVGPKTAGPPILRIPLQSPADRARSERHLQRVVMLERQLATTLGAEKSRLARELIPQAGRYMTAAWEYATLRRRGLAASTAEFAAQRGLHEFALRHWLDLLASGGSFPLMTTRVTNVQGRDGVHAWKGQGDTPVVTLNTTGEEVTIQTYRLPPGSVTVHPGPLSGVCICWTSPVAGLVRVSGRLADADNACGDGVSWALVHRTATGERELARGEFPNGSRQDLGAQGVGPIRVAASERLELRVLPRYDHACDSTVVALSVAAGDGATAWDLAGDLLDGPLQGNPHADRRGHAGVWRLEDMNPGANEPFSGDLKVRLDRWRRAASRVPGDLAAVVSAARDFQKAFSLSGQASPFWVRSEEEERSLPAASLRKIGAIRSELAALRNDPPPPVTYANGAQEGGVPGSPHAGVHDVRVHVRGSYSRLGDVVPRHFPAVLTTGSQPPIVSGSGRLELARWLARPDHVLTARVMVNRVWQHHLGAGIVRTPSNFGKLGERPTHPELLDHLARLFVERGWSVKQMHRAIMLSATYQQSSEPAAETAAADPGNRLFGHANRRRLESEAIRDNLLAVSGELDHSPGGPAIRGLDQPRRTLYIKTVRSDRSSFGPLFDAADPTAMVDVRTVSTVAPQSLFLLNSPFVLDRARALARRLRAERGDDRARVERAYALLYGRPPDADEIELGLSSLATSGPADAAWDAYCQVLLCANEFVYID